MPPSPFYPATKTTTDTTALPVIFPVPSNPHSRDVKRRLQLLDERPLVVADFRAVVLLERINALPRDERVQGILFFELASIERLVRPFDLDGDGWLALFAEGDLFVVALDGGAVEVECQVGNIYKAADEIAMEERGAWQ